MRLPGPEGPSALVSTGGRKEVVVMGCRKGEGGGDEVGEGVVMVARWLGDAALPRLRARGSER
jgi:hypothetical protein